MQADDRVPDAAPMIEATPGAASGAVSVAPRPRYSYTNYHRLAERSYRNLIKLYVCRLKGEKNESSRKYLMRAIERFRASADWHRGRYIAGVYVPRRVRDLAYKALRHYEKSKAARKSGDLEEARARFERYRQRMSDAGHALRDYLLAEKERENVAAGISAGATARG